MRARASGGDGRDDDGVGGGLREKRESGVVEVVLVGSENDVVGFGAVFVDFGSGLDEILFFRIDVFPGLDGEVSVDLSYRLALVHQIPTF